MNCYLNTLAIKAWMMTYPPRSLNSTQSVSHRYCWMATVLRYIYTANSLCSIQPIFILLHHLVCQVKDLFVIALMSTRNLVTSFQIFDMTTFATGATTILIYPANGTKRYIALIGPSLYSLHQKWPCPCIGSPPMFICCCSSLDTDLPLSSYVLYD